MPARRGWTLGLIGGISLAIIGVAVSLWIVRHPSPPGDHWEAVRRGRAFLDRGRPDLAFHAVSQIRDDAPGAGEAMTVAGQSLIALRQIPTARRTLERALKLQPRQADAAKMLAAIYLASGDGPNGVALLDRAASLDPLDFRPWLAKGKASLDLGDFGAAADAFTHALERAIPPDEVDRARLGLARALLMGHDYERAGIVLDPLLSAGGSSPELLALAARQRQAMGRNDEALTLATRALATSPDDVDALLVRARVQSSSAQLERALEDLERAEAANANIPAVLALRAQVEARLGHHDRAVSTQDRLKALNDRLALMDDLTDQIAERPDDPEPRWKMGRAALEGDMRTLAYQCFQAALDLDPAFDPALRDMARIRQVESGQPLGPEPAP